ncbi:MAG: ATP-binding protein [Verrucomicrobiae bacterium]|nr:ATP-binding protein [Verrucomicrobiae bacterium]
MSRLIHHVCRSHPAQMSEVRARVRAAAQEFGFDENTVMRLVLAVDEACTNVIRHAYKGESQHLIELDLEAGDDVWEVRIRDYGEQCPPEQLKGRDLDDVRPGGLGLHFIRQAFDEVHYDCACEKGTLLILRKRRVPPA